MFVCSTTNILAIAFSFFSASQSLNQDDVIQTNVSMYETKYVDYPLLGSGVTIIIRSIDGDCSVIIIGSTFINTPNDAFNDFIVKTSNLEDVFISPLDAFNFATATRVYVTLIGDEVYPCTIEISAEIGDVSTGTCINNKYPHQS